MNIFVVDRDPIRAAEMLNDKHVVKMVLETCQLLSTAQRFYDIPGTYKATHKNHPCSLWVRSDRRNYEWAYKHGIALCHEYTHRYGKIHKCQNIYLTELSDSSIIPLKDMEGDLEFTQCMPDQYKCPDPIKAYRDYYNGEKSGFSRWTNRVPPKWFGG